MANDTYQIFRADVKRLARTMVIRHELSALATNRYLTNVAQSNPGGDVKEVSQDKTTWRYYMNIAGLYHSTNDMMQVLSLDTGELINFTRENMKIHRATARGYEWGGRYYTALVAMWPRQEALIQGILNPIDMQFAINARENQILWMDPNLVEEQEDNLQDLIQAQIDAVMDRWHTETYSITEDLYDCIRYTNLYAHLQAFIEHARTKNSNTERAHSFHIREWLAMNGRLDIYFDAMTLKQRLFFYRNICNLHRYPGWQESFDTLVQKVLADRNFPLADYTLIQNIEQMPTDLTPSIELVRKETTPDYAGVASTKVSVATVLAKQNRLAVSNAKVIDESQTETDTLMGNAQISEVQTKVLESSVLDMTDSQVYKLEDFLINHWAYLAVNDRYRAITTIDHPRTGEPIQLSALEAFILYLYAYNAANGIVLPIVPDLYASCVLKPVLPTPQQMWDKCADGKHASIRVAEALWDLIPEFSSYISTESFYNAVDALYNAAVDQHALAAYQGNFIARGEAEAMGMFMFMDCPISLADEIDYPSWLAVRGLANINTFSVAELDDLWSKLFQTATGSDLNTSLSLNDIHRSMIGVMQRLSSYSVHYIREINDSPLKPLANKFIGIGDSDSETAGNHDFDILKIKEIESKGLEWGKADLNVADTIKIRAVQTSGEGSSEMAIGLSFLEENETHGYSYMNMPYIRQFVPELRPVTDLSQYNVSSDLVIGPVGPRDIQLSEIIVNRVLSGLNYPETLSQLTPLSDVITATTLFGLNYPNS